MKIVFSHEGILPVLGYGGIERILFWHMAELVRLGHKVVLIGNPESKVKEFGIELVTVKGDFTSQWIEYIPEDSDIIHLSYNYKVPGKIPTIITVHGNGQIGEFFEKNSVFVSKKHAEIHGSTQYVHNAIDLKEYPYEPKTKREWKNFLFLAKTSWSVKNLKGAVKAARISHKHLHVAGGHWFGLSRFVHNHGIVGGIDKMKIIRSCDFMVFPVRWHEPFGIAVIEAMSQGLPVIGSSYGSLPELISKETGFIANNQQELNQLVGADASKQFNPDGIRKYVEDNFNITKHAEKYLMLYEKVINGAILNETNPIYQFQKRPETLLPY
ncbi:MAG: glycosyltransferase [Bacteriovorax sp.]|nr:glycosyltransferase [Bacteriovorax sp.]